MARPKASQQQKQELRSLGFRQSVQTISAERAAQIIRSLKAGRPIPARKESKPFTADDAVAREKYRAIVTRHNWKGKYRPI